ncbi:MAG: hypothetical protein M1833_003782 [Piccolia ochrophora]|nr:MAG: hypothetical protein M1833_003782 [Piccolia ochrophora]
MVEIPPRKVRDSALADVFSFTAGPKPSYHLSFPKPSSPPIDTSIPRMALKRGRPLADVDGEGPVRARKKKRRLRLLLITSRLSLPFSAPPTHIVDRGASKIAVWARQKALGRNVLRKAAIMNSIREQAAAARRAEQRQLELARQAFIRHQSSIAQVPRRQYIPLPPSPLGLSNYDALDLEDDIQCQDDDDESDGNTVYSDFSILDPSESVIDDYDSLHDFDSLPQKRRPPSPPDEKMLEMLREKERQKEIAFLDLG